MDKKTLRNEVVAKRDLLTEKDYLEYSQIITDTLYEMDAYKDAKRIMIFISLGSEINTHPLIKQAIKDGKSVVVPITIPNPKHLKASELWDFSELEVGFHNILSPKEEFIRVVEPGTIDLILVPGAIFAKDGYRIGYGGGYYDRFLGSLEKPVPKIGIGFDLQIMDKVPTADHDIPVDLIITEKRVIDCSRKEI